jgi:hypothetical protein
MKVLLRDTGSGELAEAQLLPAELRDMRTITDGWYFNWRKHFRLPYSKAFKIVAGNQPGRIEGLMIFH